MKSYCIAVKSKDGKFNIVFGNLESYAFYKRPAVKELMTFYIKDIFGKADENDQDCLQFEGYKIFSFKSVMIITDLEYPMRIAFEILKKISLQKDPVLSDYLKDPKEFDSISKVQNELDETKIILNVTLEKLLLRSDKLEDIVNKTTELSSQTKSFLATSRKMNKSCCTYL